MTSDQVHICKKCGSIISPYLDVSKIKDITDAGREQCWTCKTCTSSEFIAKVSIPFVLQYLVSELASVNIKIQFKAN